MTDKQQAPSEADVPKIKKVKVTLKKPHTHKGIFYDKKTIDEGVKIDITEAQAAALKKQGVI